MRKISLVLTFLIMLPLALRLDAKVYQEPQSVQNAMIQDLEVAKYGISIKYAPAEWKSEHFGWNLEEAFEKSKARILDENPKTSKDYQKIFTEFLASLKDYHVRSIYYSTSWSMFPIQVRGVNGRYFLTDLYSDFTLGSDDDIFFSLEQSDIDLIINNFKGVFVGDEIIEVNGQPIKDLVEQLIDENFYGDRSPTGYALAERNLFLRRGKLGQEVPSGTFQITFMHEGERKPFTCTLPWIHIPEWVTNHILRSQCEKETGVLSADDFSSQNLMKNPIAAINKLFVKDFSVSLAKEMAPQSISSVMPLINRSIQQSLDKGSIQDERIKGSLPTLGRVIWETELDEELYAYLYLHPSGKHVGYIYLPTFDESGALADHVLSRIIRALKVFNNRADALVVDITDNTGGNLMFMYAVLSVLTDYPLKVPAHKELLIQEDVYKAALFYNLFKGYEISPAQSQESSETLSGYPLTKKVVEQILSYTSTVMQTWESGARMTDLLYLFGVDEVMPNPDCQFKKPIIVLTNEFNFSCADFFPAIIQDNKRGKIFGKKTAGAGGYVKNYPHTSRFGVQGFSLTASIAYRPDGTPIENLGVTPDLPYNLTINDVRKSYVDYVRRLNLEIKKMIK